MEIHDTFSLQEGLSCSRQLALGKGIAAGMLNCWGLPMSPMKGGTDKGGLKSMSTGTV